MWAALALLHPGEGPGCEVVRKGFLEEGLGSWI